MKFLKALAFVASILVMLSSCQKEYSVENGGSAGNAGGNLNAGVSGECLPATVVGTYTAGTVLDASNYIVVSVDITALGAYNIVSNIVNGYSFSVSGVATTLGVQTIQLKATGTPTTSGANTFTINFGTSQCNLVVDVVATGGTAPNTWTFKVGSTTYSGTTSPATLTTTPAVIVMNGTNTAGGNFTLSLGNLSGPIESGNYPGNITMPGKSTLGFSYAETGGVNYVFVPFVSGNISSIVTVFDAGTKNIQGTFSGTAVSNGGSGTSVTITDGRFNAFWP